MNEILNIIHKTIYQFFDVCEDDEEVPMSDKDKLLLKVNKAICNNLKALEQEHRWIPVTERLPEAGEYVSDVAKYYLVQNEYGDMLVARYTHEEYWEQMYQLRPIADEIVAWRPLPEQYKAESEDVLDKIRTEILQMPTISLNANDIYKADVLSIIDKYKAESEDME